MSESNLEAGTPDYLFGVDASLGGRFWTLGAVADDTARALTAKSGGNDLIGRLLGRRGVAPDSVAGFLKPTMRDTFPDPSSFADMDKAAELTLDALIAGANVTVFADYDVDGGTASAILTRYFRAWGQELGLYVPDRLTEGYGPSPAAFRHLKETGSDLVITVDCGAAARDALAEAEKIDLPVIVLDHHLMHGELPKCAALVNPNRPDCPSGCGHLAGAGVAYVFAVALNRLARERQQMPSSGSLPDLMEWLDLCALGTLCDMAPLEGVNRAFAIQGLKIMSRHSNTGLKALAEVAGIGQIETVYHATFMLGPRLNAGGRIGDPWLAAKLLATDDRDEAIQLSERLHGLNDERKAVEAAILEEAISQAEKALARDPDKNVIVASGEGWHPGVIGIVAGRLKDRLHLPSVVIGWGDGLGDIAKGSARSVTGVNIGDAISDAAKDGIIASGGGHAMAGGLSLDPDKIPDFEAWLNTRIGENRETVLAARELCVDAVLAPGAATPELCDSLEQLGPFGAAAPQPVFALKAAYISGARIIGDNHLKFVAEDASGRLECVAWRSLDTAMGDAIRGCEQLHIVGRIKINEWNGKRRVQFDVSDVSAVS
ncbi:MAG: single-stranded-DNA-specific exonuclease RecJ [Hyphomonadaceae bacterium]